MAYYIISSDTGLMFELNAKNFEKAFRFNEHEKDVKFAKQREGVRTELKALYNLLAFYYESDGELVRDKINQFTDLVAEYNRAAPEKEKVYFDYSKLGIKVKHKSPDEIKGTFESIYINEELLNKNFYL